MPDALVSVHAKPGSRTTEVLVRGDAIVVRVTERAYQGKANEACRRALADALRVPPSRVELVRGARSKHKLFRISGMSELAFLAWRATLAALPEIS